MSWSTVRPSGKRRTGGKTTPRSVFLQHGSRTDLKTVVTAGQRLQLQVVGLARIADDVTPELARAAMPSMKLA